MKEKTETDGKRYSCSVTIVSPSAKTDAFSGWEKMGLLAVIAIVLAAVLWLGIAGY